MRLEEDDLAVLVDYWFKDFGEDPKYERTKVLKEQNKIFSQCKECEMDKKQYENISEKTDQKHLGEMIEKYRRRRTESSFEAICKARIERYKKEEDREFNDRSRSSTYKEEEVGYRGPYKKKYYNRVDKKYYNDREFKERSRSRDRANVEDIKKKEDDEKNKEDLK